MVNIQFVKKKIGETYLIWFKKSNLFYQFKGPVWFVFERLLQNIKNETIANEFSKHYSTDFKESLNFVNDVHVKINELDRSENTINNTEQLLPDLSSYYNYKAYSSYKYFIGDQYIKFSFETNWLENYVHPLIEHLEVKNRKLNDNHFELFTYKNRVIFRFNDKIIGNWSYNEGHLVKGKIFMVLINTIYEKTESNWLMTVHASAITNGTKTILFSAPPNSGKSTIAALLYNQGYQLISDDFVAIDKHSFKAYPFPSAMSVKEKSLDLLKPFFPSLEQKRLNYINDNKSVRYLPLDNNTSMIFPVKEFIFIKYDTNINFEWEKLNPLDGIQLLLEQTWVTPTLNNVKILFDKVEESSFFQLTYHNNEKALKTIKQLFDYD